MEAKRNSEVAFRCFIGNYLHVLHRTPDLANAFWRDRCPRRHNNNNRVEIGNIFPVLQNFSKLDEEVGGEEDLDKSYFDFISFV